MLLAAAPPVWPAAALALPADQPLPSKVYGFDELHVNRHNGNETRAVLTGRTYDGQQIEVHETKLGAGNSPHPPHRHVHEEMFLIRNGTVRVIINERSSEIGPGSVAFVHSGDLHGIVNAGQDPAEYFVIAFGAETP
jgi:mannose-6-phosphate isomerase-like protein (cupin superfamily)